ncbi:MAG: hypothetical protein ACL93V_16650 [Candidatus Electrothrix sp. YB6]
MTSSEPIREVPATDWDHYKLFKRVKEAIYSLPLYFRTETNIEGISATDIFTLNSALGATIESQVVQTLNNMRALWDPDEEYVMYSFVRQSQTFPDVLLKKIGDSSDVAEIILGIELKGWYLLAKEAEPSFRFQVTPSACAVHDLIVVVPWALNNVISGSPKVFVPYVEFSRYAAAYRNYHWQYLRQAKSNTNINIPTDITPYPKKSDPISDKPVSDGGGNFGRFARTGLMDSYLHKAKEEHICGISAEHWLTFFKVFQDQKSITEVRDQIKKIKAKVLAKVEGDENTTLINIQEILLYIDKIVDEL